MGNKDYAKLYELLDTVTEIDSLKENPTYSTLLAYFDSSSGVNPIVAKLPHSIQEKWITEASNHKLRSGIPYPAFPVFVAFLEKITRIKYDPSLQFDTAQDANRYEQPKALPEGRKVERTALQSVHSKHKYVYRPQEPITMMVHLLQTSVLSMRSQNTR